MAPSSYGARTSCRVAHADRVSASWRQSPLPEGGTPHSTPWRRHAGGSIASGAFHPVSLATFWRESEGLSPVFSLDARSRHAAAAQVLRWPPREQFGGEVICIDGTSRLNFGVCRSLFRLRGLALKAWPQLRQRRSPRFFYEGKSFQSFWRRAQLMLMRVSPTTPRPTRATQAGRRLFGPDSFHGRRGLGLERVPRRAGA
jgi:hypothetical protein